MHPGRQLAVAQHAGEPLSSSRRHIPRQAKARQSQPSPGLRVGADHRAKRRCLTEVVVAAGHREEPLTVAYDRRPVGREPELETRPVPRRIQPEPPGIIDELPRQIHVPAVNRGPQRHLPTRRDTRAEPHVETEPHRCFVVLVNRSRRRLELLVITVHVDRTVQDELEPEPLRVARLVELELPRPILVDTKDVDVPPIHGITQGDSPVGVSRSHEANQEHDDPPQVATVQSVKARAYARYLDTRRGCSSPRRLRPT